MDVGAAELRGAGYSEFADSILLLSRKKSGTSERFTLKYTLRHDEEPPDKILVPNGPLFEVGEEDSLVSISHVVQAIEAEGGRIEGRANLVKRIRAMTMDSDQTAINAIVAAENDGAIFSARREGRGRAKTFVLAGDDDA